jgi:hypothetical protein
MKAFPSKNAPYYINEDGASAHQSGMDLRDYFASKAMQAMLVNRNEASYLQSMPKICYQWADAMMEARKK